MSSPERELSLSEYKANVERRLNEVSLDDIIYELVVPGIRADTQAQADAALELARNKYPLPRYTQEWRRAFNKVTYTSNFKFMLLYNCYCASWILFALENLNVGDTNPEETLTLHDAPALARLLNSGKLPDILRKILNICGEFGDISARDKLAFCVARELVKEINNKWGLKADFLDKFISVMDTLTVLAIDRGDASIVSETQKDKITEMIANNINKKTRLSGVSLVEVLRKIEEYKIIDLGMMKAKLLEREDASLEDQLVIKTAVSDINHILDGRADAGERRIIRSAGGGGAGGGSAGGDPLAVSGVNPPSYYSGY